MKKQDFPVKSSKIRIFFIKSGKNQESSTAARSFINKRDRRMKEVRVLYFMSFYYSVD
jgi:hypothetical protein